MNQAVKTEENRHIAIDGLRGVAILMVMLRHFYNENIIKDSYPIIGPIITKIALAGNYGVELFFVLSGFLITQLLLDTKRAPRYFINFYLRRFLRIFPLYYGVLFIIFFILPHIVAFDEAAKNIASQQIWLWTYLSNAPWVSWIWDNSDIFRLGHLWFLCVVVHFYIIWPFVVYKVEKHNLINICLVGLIVCLLIRIFYTATGGPKLFTWSSITKFDGLLVGSFLAAGMQVESVQHLIKKYAGIITLISGLLFSLLIFVPRRYMWDTSFYYWTIMETITVLFFGGLLVFALRAAGRLPSFMKNKTLVAFGKYSYGLFVIHNICLPLFQWTFKPTALAVTLHSALAAQIIFYILTITASFTLAFISWHLYEKHFLKLKRLFQYKDELHFEKA